MRLLLRLALLAYPQPMRARYAEEIAGFPVSFFALLDIAFSGLRERLDGLVRDVRHASRSLLRTPGATFVAVLALALGVGANVAVYSVVRPVLLEPLPFSDADRLYDLRVQAPPRPGGTALFSKIAFDYHYLNWHDAATRFEAVEAWRGNSQILLFDGQAEFASVGFVTSGLMKMLGVQPRVGRAFVAADYALDAPDVALVSDRFWRARYGAEKDVVGKTLTLNEQPYEVVGVAPPALSRLWDADIFQPLRLDEGKVRGGGPNYTLGIVAKLAEAATIDEARDELQAILKSHDSESYQRIKRGLAVAERLDSYLVGGQVESTLKLLWGAVLLVLLIGCSNVAGVLSVRGLARHGETGLRLALGAGGRSLFRQAVTESMLIALLGGSAGVLLAYGGVSLLAASLLRRFPRAGAISVDEQALLFALAVAVACGLLLGLAPAWIALRQKPADTIRMRAPAATASRGLGRLRGSLVALQVALTAVLLTVAGLFLHSLVRLGEVDVGVYSLDTASISVTLPQSYPTEARRVYYHELLERARALPGVRAASLSNHVPLGGFSYGTAFRLPDDPPVAEGSEEARERDAGRRTMVNAISEGYFETVGARLLEGRALEPGDELTGNVVINRRLAEMAFPGEEVLGRTIGLSGLEGDFTVVGVIQDYRQLSPRRAVEAEVFVHWRSEFPNRPTTLAARPGDSGGPLAPLLREAALDLHPSALIRGETTQGELLASKSADDRFRTGLIGLFAVIAALLAGSGIFATVSFTVSRRTREIAIRRALGATSAAVCAGALRGAMLACGIGAALGLIAAYWLRSLTDGMLFGVEPTDPATYVAAALALLLLAAAASLGPASRAARLDPARNLRAE